MPVQNLSILFIIDGKRAELRNEGFCASSESWLQAVEPLRQLGRVLFSFLDLMLASPLAPALFHLYKPRPQEHDELDIAGIILLDALTIACRHIWQVICIEQVRIDQIGRANV